MPMIDACNGSEYSELAVSTLSRRSMLRQCNGCFWGRTDDRTVSRTLG